MQALPSLRLAKRHVFASLRVHPSFTKTYNQNRLLTTTFNNKINFQVNRAFNPTPYKHQKIPFAIPQILSRPFHSSQVVQAPIPVLPILAALFKSPVTANVIRILSRLSLSLLPWVKFRGKGQNTTRILLLIPIVGVGLSAIAGIERAPHTNRLRFLFVSEEDERQLTEELVNETLAGVTVLDDSDPRVQLVRHVCKNLCQGLSPNREYLRNHISNDENVENTADPKHITQDALAEAQKLMVNQVDREVLAEKKKELSENPFNVYVVKDSDVNAASFGRSYVIVVNTGYLEYIQNDENFLAATLAHEISHILQRHTCEGHGLSHLAYMVTDIARTLLWIPMAALGPFFTDLVSSFTENAISTTVNNRYNQPLEHEADFLGLQLMALAGYDPEFAVEFWRQSAQNPTEYVIYDPGNDPESVQKIEENWFRTHPTDSSRADRLEAQLPMALGLFEQTLREKGAAPPFCANVEAVESSDLPPVSDQHLIARVIKKLLELWYGPVVGPQTDSH